MSTNLTVNLTDAIVIVLVLLLCAVAVKSIIGFFKPNHGDDDEED